MPAAAALAATAALGDLGERTRVLLLFWGGAHVFYLAASRVATRPKPAGRSHRRAVALVIAVGLIPRLALIPAEPTLSEDVYRYLWDGRLVAQGVNPYPRPPTDPTLSRFHDGLEERLNHGDVPTIYPPVAQYLFGATARVEATPRNWKLTLLALEVALVLALAWLLRRRGLAPERLLLYYWNPLVVIESYGSGHVDVAAGAFLVLALALKERRREAGAGVAFALAVLTKYIPLLLVPALLRARAWRALGVAAVVAAVLFAPFLGDGASLGGGLKAYARHWEFNGSLFPLLRAIFPHGDGARLLLSALLALAAVAIGVRIRSLTGAALAVWAAFLLASPTVYPWYLVPGVALLPLHPDPGLLLFSGLVALTYLPLAEFRATGAWVVPAWVSWVEYGGLAVAWAVAWFASRAARRTRATPRSAGSGPLRGVYQREDSHVEESEEIEEKERERRE